MPFNWLPFLTPAQLVPKLLSNPILAFLIQLILMLFINPLKFVSGLSRVLLQSFDGLERETAYNVQAMLEVAAHSRNDFPQEDTPPSSSTVTLPTPLLRYLNSCNPQKQPVKFAFMKQTGKFRFLNNSSALPQPPPSSSPSSSSSKNSSQWHTITADEYLTGGTCAPGLCIRARINISKFSNLTGYVSLIQGRAISHWRSWSLFPSNSNNNNNGGGGKKEEKVDLDPTAALARWLVGAACCGCAALQPSPWLSWEPLYTETDDDNDNITTRTRDDFRARITVRGDGGSKVAAIVQVNTNGELVKMTSEQSIQRRVFDNGHEEEMVYAHQVAYFSKYTRNSTTGAMAPSEVEVAWEIDGKSQSYAVLHIDELRCWDRF
jgi:hypothetical protein